MATNGRGPSSPVNLVAGGTYVSGRVYILGGLVCIAAADAATGEGVAVYTEGRFSVPKQTGFALSAGDPVYFDDGSDNRAENNASLPCIGVCVADAGSSATSVDVLLVQTGQAYAGLRKDNLAASARPAVTDDVDLGYTVGSQWQYQGVRWICTDNSDGAAKWRALNTIAASVTIASGQTTGTAALPTGAANGDHVQVSQTADMTNEVGVSRAVATGGNVVIHLTGDPGASGATLACRILPADVG